MKTKNTFIRSLLYIQNLPKNKDKNTAVTLNANISEPPALVIQIQWGIGDPIVVYFVEQTGAMHCVTWPKCCFLLFFPLLHLFSTFFKVFASF